MVVLGLLDHVSPDDLGIAVLILLEGDKVDLFEQLLLVILEFSHHLDGLALLCCCREM